MSSGSLEQIAMACTPLELVVDKSLVLREYSLRDAEPAFELIDRNREHLSQFRNSTPEHYPCLGSFSRSITHPQDPHRKRFSIWTRDTLVGSIGITPHEPYMATVDYYLGREFQGNGYITRAVNRTVQHIFEDMRRAVVLASVHPYNYRSQKVLQRTKFHRLDVPLSGMLVYARYRL